MTFYDYVGAPVHKKYPTTIKEFSNNTDWNGFGISQHCLRFFREMASANYHASGRSKSGKFFSSLQCLELTIRSTSIYRNSRFLNRQAVQVSDTENQKRIFGEMEELIRSRSGTSAKGLHGWQLLR